MAGRLPTTTPASALGLASPSAFMKLQTPEMDPECWYAQEVPPLGVGDIFADPGM